MMHKQGWIRPVAKAAATATLIATLVAVPSANCDDVKSRAGVVLSITFDKSKIRMRLANPEIERSKKWPGADARLKLNGLAAPLFPAKEVLVDILPDRGRISIGTDKGATGFGCMLDKDRESSYANLHLGLRANKIKQVYLTIDDGPSDAMGELLDYLIASKYSAVFFCDGSKIEKNMDVVVRAIKNGFIIGNHSYGHNCFSKISFEEGKEEILRTERIIEEAHKKAGVPRQGKYFRFPYGDLGGANAKKYQLFLKEQGFSAPLATEKMTSGEAVHDWRWTLDTEDWKLALKRGRPFTLDNVRKILNALEDKDVVLVHDHGSIINFLEMCGAIENMGFVPAKPEAEQH